MTAKSQIRFNRRPGILITVAGVLWKYSVSAAGIVLAFSVNGDRRITNAPALNGISFRDWDIGHLKSSKKPSDGQVTQEAIASWLAVGPSASATG